MKQPKDMTKDELIRLFEMCANKHTTIYQRGHRGTMWEAVQYLLSGAQGAWTKWQRTKRAALLDLFERLEKGQTK